MDSHNHTDQRLTELEIKASYAEDLLDALNQVIVRQQADIALLVREIQQIKLLVRERSSDPHPGNGNSNELPPHY
ncbi:MAG: SlyX family protein [Rhodoferax sp.]|nr:SlyX family protein [Rhodoferax sp.]MCF8210465.1 SlyX family protein [Rhodoferax sp.]